MAIGLFPQQNSTARISTLPIEKSIKRYLLLDPSGNALVLGPDHHGYPHQQLIGNIVHDFDGVAAAIERNEYFPTDQSHGV
jgi:hypothetical protein